MSIIGNEWSTIFALDSVREFPAKNKSYFLAATKIYRLDSKALAKDFSIEGAVVPGLLFGLRTKQEPRNNSTLY